MTAWVIGFTILTVVALNKALSASHDAKVLGHQNKNRIADTAHLSNENEDRIADIQATRLASCRQTYEGIRSVFKPFLGDAKTRTPQQQKDIDKFNDRIDELKAGCDKQVEAKP